MRELDTAAQNYACFLDDLFPDQKEVQFDGEIHDIVLVVEDLLDVDRMTAREVAAELMGTRMEQFEHIVATGLPALFEDAQRGENAQKSLTPARRRARGVDAGDPRVAPPLPALHRGGADPDARSPRRRRVLVPPHRAGHLGAATAGAGAGRRLTGHV
ncbi:MAG: germacradienol/geosmin synthase [Pseudonocardiales bacterium]|jgi:germacradienol/geosmin synthase|nr:germacradienol/geosmin synthase [Pseudonocardiales bacterium]